MSHPQELKEGLRVEADSRPGYYFPFGILGVPTEPPAQLKGLLVGPPVSCPGTALQRVRAPEEWAT